MAPVPDYGHGWPAWFAAAEPLTLADHVAAESFRFSPRGNGIVGPLPPGDVPQPRWIVRFTAESLPGIRCVDDAAGLLGGPGAGFRVVRGLGLPGQVLVASLFRDETAAETALRNNPHVAEFEPDTVVSAQLVPNDPEFPQLWNLHNTGTYGATADADIDAPEAWDITTGSPAVVVGVIDSGIDPTHPDLYLNIWINQGEIPSELVLGLTDVDDDGLFTFRDLNHEANAEHVADLNGNGYVDARDLLNDPRWAEGSDTDQNGFVDDIYGWDFRNSDPDPWDDLGHGTHVAGTLAAIGHNQTGIAGVSWSSSLMALKFLGENNTGRMSDAVAAVHYSTMIRSSFDTNVCVTNNSWGGEAFSTQLRDAIDQSKEAGILFVAAAGNGSVATQRGIDNDQHPFYPASYDLDNIIAVAASDQNDRLARFSNYGVESVDLAAPGVGIFTTEPAGGYGAHRGTSMAAPHVTGVAALLWANVPHATVAEVREAILKAADSKTEWQNILVTGGRLNALESLLTDTVPPQARLISAPHILAPRSDPQQITVNYADDQEVDASSLDDLDIVVTCLSGPREGQTFGTTLVGADPPLSNGPDVTVVYEMAPPAGSFGTLDSGAYQVWLQSGQVRDAEHNYARPAVLGTFTVDIFTDGFFLVDSFADTVDANPGDGVAEDSSGQTTLRAAIQEANTSEGQFTIVLDDGEYLLAIAGADEDAAASGDLDITGDVTIVGEGADATIINAGALDRVFDVQPGGVLNLEGVRITGGKVSGARDGGGIRNRGELAITESTVSGSSTGQNGGGIYNHGVMTSTAATVCGNSADASGGGLYNHAALVVTQSTISGNSAAEDGGGVYNHGTVTITNSTLSGNTAANHGGGVYNTETAASTITNVTIAGNSADGADDVLALERVDTEFLVNTYTNLRQNVPAVAVDAAGNYVVAWEAGGVHGIAGQRYDASGIPQGGEFETGERTTDNRMKPSVAMTPAGDFVVAWQHQLPAAWPYLEAQRYLADGTPVGDAVLADPPVPGVMAMPRVAIAANGDFVIVWAQPGGDGDHYGLFAERFNWAGESQGAFLVNTTTDGAQSYPSIAMSPSGEFVIAWSGNGPGDDKGVFARRYDTDGNPLGSEFLVNTTTADIQDRPSAAMDADGGFAVTWVTYDQQGNVDGILARRYDKLGQPHGGEFQVNAIPAGDLWSTWSPKVAIGAEGDLFVAWQVHDPQPEEWAIFARHFAPDGAAQGSEFQVNSGIITDQAGPAIAIASGGDNVVVSWSGDGSQDQDTDIFAQQFVITAHDGGGIFNAAGGTVNVKSTIVADNCAGHSSPDVTGDFNSQGYNLIGKVGNASGLTDGVNGDQVGTAGAPVDPLLGPLQDNGGPTLTHALLPGSPAIDAGTNTDAPQRDQRGVPRPQDADNDGTATVDIGAFERYYGEIRGLEFHDLDGDGERDADEPGLPDLTIYLDLNNNDLCDAGEPTALTMADDPLTPDVDETGTYHFAGLEPRTYIVMSPQRRGWQHTSPGGAGLAESTLGNDTLFVVDSFDDAVDANPGDGIAADASGDATLRAAIMEANALAGDDVILLPAGTYTLSLPGIDEDGAATGDLDISDNLTIIGAGADATVIDADELDRVFQIMTGVTATLSDITVTGGRIVDPGSEISYGGGGISTAGRLTITDCTITGNSAIGTFTKGGGVFNDKTGNLTISNGLISENSAALGGGILNDGTTVIAKTTVDGNAAAGIYNNFRTFDPGTVEITDSTISNNLYSGITQNGGAMWITNSTISGNSNSSFYGGGIAQNCFPMWITNCTISNNSAKYAGGIDAHDDWGPLNIKNTIIAGNSATMAWPDVHGPFASQGNNLVGDSLSGTGFVGSDLLDVDPLLGPLQDNGGATSTHAPLPGSPAIDAGNNDGAPATDQRGLARPQDGDYDDTPVADIGAFEFQPGRISVDDVCVAEGDTGTTDAVFTVSLADRSDTQVTVEVDTADGTATLADNDYHEISDLVLTFEPGGPLSQTVAVLVNGDTVLEPDEDFYVNLSNATGGVILDGRGKGTIVDAGPARPGRHVLAVGTGQVFEEIDFGSRALPGQIRGRKFSDLDNDGFKDFGEPGLEDWTIYLDLNDSGDHDGEEPSATTDENGRYSFTELKSLVTYTVAEVQQEGWEQTFPGLISGRKWTLRLDPGQMRTNVDFGNYDAGTGGQVQDGVITGRLFLDRDGDGVQDPEDPGLEGWTVYLDLNDNRVLDGDDRATLSKGNDPATPEVDETGIYEFDGLGPGAYILRLDVGQEASQTSPLGNDLAATVYGGGVLDETQSVAIGDLDGDEDPDLAVANGDVVSLLFNDGQGTFSAPEDIPLGIGAYGAFSVVTEDFNSDEHLDLAVTNVDSSNVSVLLGLGGGSFEPAELVQVGVYPMSVAAGDVDHDGDVDLAVANELDGDVSVLLNDGSGRFPTRTDYPVGTSPFSVIFAQLDDDNGDGGIDHLDYPDLATANLDTDDVSILLNDRSGSFPVTESVSLPGGSGPSCVTSGDLNGDGSTDLAVAALFDNSVSILFGDGEGGFTLHPPSLPAGAGPYSVKIADLDGDEDADLIVTNATAEHLSVLRNYADGSFSLPENYGVGDFPTSVSYSVAVEDLNDDGTPDLAVANGDASNVSVLLNTVIEGHYRVALTGVETVAGLDFGAIMLTEEPTLDEIHDPHPIDEDAGEQTVYLTGITAGGTETQPLAVTATSDNPGLIPHPAVTYTSPETTGSLSYAPLPDRSGAAVITVTVTDGGFDEDLQTARDNQSFSRTFTVTVNAVNDAPTLDSIDDPARVDEGAGEQTIHLTGITAGGGETQPLAVTATSDNTDLIPDPAVTYTSPETTGSLSYTPVPGRHGTAQITVTVTDGGLDRNLGTAGDNATFSRAFTVAVYNSPTAEDDTFTGIVANSTDNVLDVLANDLVEVGRPLTIVGLGPTSDEGEVTIDAGIRLLYTPAPGFTGIETFAYFVTDGSGFDQGSVSVTVGGLPPASVYDRRIFYNNSAFDGGNPAANEQDDDAIATDKVALLPGTPESIAALANYTSYSRGINGIMVDIENLVRAGELNLENLQHYFHFQVGNSGPPGDWIGGPTPATVTVRETPAAGNVDRVTLIWPDYAIRNTWLEVKLLANEYTGLLQPDVFYFGNAVGESGNSTSDAVVDETDVALARTNPHNFFNPALVTSPYDYNRDARVNATDLLIARSNQTTEETALRLIDLTGLEGDDPLALLISPREAFRPLPAKLAHLDAVPPIREVSTLDAVVREIAERGWAARGATLTQWAWLWGSQKPRARSQPSGEHRPAPEMIDMLIGTCHP